MKKIIIFVLTALCATAPVFSQSRSERQIKKEAKTATKDLKWQGYKLLELGDMQVKLEEYLTKAYAGCQQVIGTAEDCSTLNLAKLTAQNNAINEYAASTGGLVKGRITSNTSNISSQQIDDIVAGFERLILQEIKGELITYVTLVKEHGKKYDVKVYCLVDYESAHQSKARAMKVALEELKIAEEYGSQISSWIDEGLEK